MEDDMHERTIATSLSQLVLALNQCRAERHRKNVLDLELSMIRSERDVLKDSLYKVLLDGVEKANLHSQSTKDILKLQATIMEHFHKLKVIHNYASTTRSPTDHGSKALTFVGNVLEGLSGIETATALVGLSGESTHSTSPSAGPVNLAETLLDDLERLTGFSTSSKEPGSSFGHFFDKEDGKEQLMDLVLSCGVTDARFAQSPDPSMPAVPLPSLRTNSVEITRHISPKSAKSDDTKQGIVQTSNQTEDINFDQLIKALYRGDNSFSDQSAGGSTPSTGTIDDVLRCNRLDEAGSEWSCPIGEYNGECTEGSGMAQQDWATTAGYA